jgi:hypothetical protein
MGRTQRRPRHLPSGSRRGQQVRRQQHLEPAVVEVVPDLAGAGDVYWHVEVLLLPVPGGVHRVSREMCHPESEMSNRYGGRMFARRSS